MRVSSVTAKAFGGIEDQTLDLGPGLNVLYGETTRGKSTWHAALYAGLCGYVPGRTAADNRIRQFEPDELPTWAVSMEVELASGEHISIDRDLQAHRDVATSRDGRPASARFTRDGVLDLATALGRDRWSFAESSWVAQSRHTQAFEVVDRELVLRNRELYAA